MFFLILLVCLATSLDSILEDSLTFLKVKRKVAKYVVLKACLSLKRPILSRFSIFSLNIVYYSVVSVYY